MIKKYLHMYVCVCVFISIVLKDRAQVNSHVCAHKEGQQVAEQFLKIIFKIIIKKNSNFFHKIGFVITEEKKITGMLIIILRYR